MLDCSNVYTKKEEIIERSGFIIEKDEEMQYSTHTYIAQMLIIGHNYKRKGDIRLNELNLKYTNLDKWVDWETKTPVIKKKKETINVEFKNLPEKRVKLGNFDIVIKKPYLFKQEKYNMQINNEVIISVQNIKNKYIANITEIITYLQFFLVLCTGENINVTNIKAVDFYDRNIELILGYGKSNYDNKSIIKNIIKYKDIESNLEIILRKWLNLYIDNELLVANFINLQTREELLISEYTNLMTAIDNLYLVIINKENTKDHIAEILKRLIKETNFILKLSEEEINKIANTAKDIRRYFVHSNKTQRSIVRENISLVRNIMNFLIEVIRSRIMLEIGIEESIIREYYNNVEDLQYLKFSIVNNINEDEIINDERIEKGKKIMNPLSNKDKEDIAQLNAIMGTTYRESGYNLENENDLIEATEYITAEYMDYANYWGKIENVIEDFDQSIEVYHPEKWFRSSINGTTGKEIIDQTMSSLYKASDDMNKLFQEAEKGCIEVWKFLLLGDSKKAKEYFVGDISRYSEEELIYALEDTIENIFEIKYENQIQEDAKCFGESIRESLEEIKKQEDV